MVKLPELGKVTPEFFDEVIFPNLGVDDDTVIVKPRHGVDFGVIEIGDNVIVMSSDPVYIMPSLGWERAAWFAYHILASDVAVSGIKPRYLTIDLNLPPEMDEETLKIIWKTIHEECKKMGVSIVCGHTARYAGCNYPMVGGATIIGIGTKEELVTPEGIRVGDKVIISKGPAVETTGLMSVQFPEFLEEVHGTDFVKKAQSVFYQMTTVYDALTAARVGVSSMHDATECGVWGGLFEMAKASGCGMRIIKEEIPIQEVIKQTCEVFEIDPFKAISEGTLLATARPDRADEVVEALKKEGFLANIVGEVLPREKGILIVDEKGEHPLEHPRVDPFWIRFEEYLLKQEERRKKK
ncbi:MAG: AIR synthase family protein [Candidatus Hydrothermarchaeota archaeon]